MGDRRRGIEVQTAIGKRIRGDIDDAHHLRTIQPQHAATAIQCRSDVEHHGLFLERTRLPMMLSTPPSTTPTKPAAKWLPAFTPKLPPATVAMTISGRRSGGGGGGRGGFRTGAGRTRISDDHLPV